MEALVGLVRHSGNELLFRAVEMSIVSTLAGVPLHLHAEGLRGTGKTTILRAARRVVPRIRRVRGCLYNCDPVAPHCPQHRNLDLEELALLGDELVPMPFLEISHSARVGTVVGSIDLTRLVNPTLPAAALLPGTLPQAHRGVVLVDEVNRLAETSPELADVLLDIMGTKPGRIQIEETGLPTVEIPVSVSVWAASNPDEDPGPLEEVRRQLSDRFDFVIPTSRPVDAQVVAEILGRFERSHCSRPAPAEAPLQSYRDRLVRYTGALRTLEVPAWAHHQVAEVYARFGLESLRAAQAILWGMRLLASLYERASVSWEDLAAVAPMALHHRVDAETLQRILHHVRGLEGRMERTEVQPPIPAGGEGRPSLLAAPPALRMPPQVPAPSPHSAMPLAAAPAPQGSAPPPETSSTPQGAQVRHTFMERLWSSVLSRSGSPARPRSAATRTTEGSAVQRSPLPPSPGQLFQRLGPTGPDAGHTHGSLRGSAYPAPPSGSPGRASGATVGSGGTVTLPDPTHIPPVAPPRTARPLGSLSSADWVSTEDDLRGGGGPWSGTTS